MRKKISIPAIPIDENLGEMLNWAVRYSLGRRTYAVSDTCRFIEPLIPHLDEHTIGLMLRDIKEQRRFGYGDDCDKLDWMQLKEALEHETEARGLTPWPILE